MHLLDCPTREMARQRMLIYKHITILYISTIQPTSFSRSKKAYICFSNADVGMFLSRISEIVILRFDRVYNNQHMSQQAGESQKVPPLYMVESLLKVVFIVMSTINAQYTIIIGLVASILAILRVCKRPQFNKDYLAKVLLNNHGQNVLYLLIGSLGFVNYLYYAPVILFFAFNLVQFAKIAFPNASIHQSFGDVLRHNKFYVYEGKAKIQVAFLAYCLLTLPLDIFGRGLKLFVIGQFLLVKYRLNQEFRFAASSINTYIEQKTSSIGFLHNGYKKVASWIYDFATRDPRAAQ